MMKEKNRPLTVWNRFFLWTCDRVFPLCFVFSSTLNLTFFYLGFAFEENPVRSYGFIAGNLIFAVICGLAALSALRQERPPLRVWLLLGLVLLFFAGCFAAGILRYGFHPTLLRYARDGIVLAFPSFFAGIYGGLKRGEGTFLQTLESCSLLAAPGALIYANSVVFNCLPWQYNAYLGVLGYMPLAYTFMPYLLALLLRFTAGEPFLFRGKALHHPQLIRGGLIALFWIAIISSATRGAFVSVLLFCLLLCFSRLLHRERAKPAVLASLAMAGVLFFNVFIYAPPGLYRLNGFNFFLKHLAHGELVTAEKEDPAISERIDELVAADSGQQVTNREEDPSGEPSGSGESPDKDNPSMGNIAGENFQIGNRGTLFKLALLEFKKSPLTGMGPGGYSIKYGLYPHTVVLELLCETGLIGSLILLSLILYALVRLGAAGWKDRHVRYVLLFLLAHAIKVNISGCLWDCPPLMCALGFGLTLPLDRTQTKLSPASGEGGLNLPEIFKRKPSVPQKTKP